MEAPPGGTAPDPAPDPAPAPDGPPPPGDGPPPDDPGVAAAAAVEPAVENAEAAAAPAAAGGHPPPSPLSGGYLLIIIGEPYSAEHRDLILQRVAKGFLSWDSSDCYVDLEKELSTLSSLAPKGEEARSGERLVQYASESLVTEVLVHPQVNTLLQCVRNLLSSFTRHRHILHAGYTFAGTGSWILQDGTFSYADLRELFHEPDVQRVLRAYENSVSVDVHCCAEGPWRDAAASAQPFTRYCKVRVNPPDVLTAGSASISGFIDYVSDLVHPAALESLLEPSDVVGNIRFSHPTLYVFPGGQGDAALFGINGFNMLVDGGFGRKSCFWDFARHLDRLDAVLLTRLNNANAHGLASLLRRKRNAHVYPQIGHFFCNLQDRKVLTSPDGDKDRDNLLVSLVDEGQEMVLNLRHLQLKPSPCYRDSVVEPVNLYHKVGHGKLDMYVVSPARDSREVKEFLAKWTANDSKLFASHLRKDSKDFQFPLQNMVSICALLVWQPANPQDNITRILFPGSTPQVKIFEGLDKIRHLEYLKHSRCTAKSLSPSPSIVGLSTKAQTKKYTPTVLDKITPGEQQKTYSRTVPTTESSKHHVLKTATIPITGGASETKLYRATTTTTVSAGTVSSAKVTSKKSEKIMKAESEKLDKTEKESIINENKQDNAETAREEQPKQPDVVKGKSKARQSSHSRERRSTKGQPVEKKDIDKKEKKEDKTSPTTPKKNVDSRVNGISSRSESLSRVQNRSSSKTRKSPSATPAKSAKEANNRKVAEAKVQSTRSVSVTRTATKTSKKEEVAETTTKSKSVEKAVSKRTKPPSPSKTVKIQSSPTKSSQIKAVNIKSERPAPIRRSRASENEDAAKTVVGKAVTTKNIKEALVLESEVPDDKETSENKLKENENGIVIEVTSIHTNDTDGNQEQVEETLSSATQANSCEEDEKKSEGEPRSQGGEAEADEDDEYLVIEKEEPYTEESCQDQVSVESHAPAASEDRGLSDEDGEDSKLRRDTQESEKVKECEKPRKKSEAKLTMQLTDKEHAEQILKSSTAECNAFERKLSLKTDVTNEAANDIISPENKEKIVEEVQDIILSATEFVLKKEEKRSSDEDKKDAEDSFGKGKVTIDDENKVGDGKLPSSELKEESQPDEKMSTTAESGATTAPTLPEDERIPLDDIKEVVEEKHVLEDTKERDQELPIVDLERREQTIPDRPGHFEICGSAVSALHRDMIKTPDEVADLPVDEEYDTPMFSKEERLGSPKEHGLLPKGNTIETLQEKAFDVFQEKDKDLKNTQIDHSAKAKIENNEKVESQEGEDRSHIKAEDSSVFQGGNFVEVISLDQKVKEKEDPEKDFDTKETEKEHMKDENDTMKPLASSGLQVAVKDEICVSLEELRMLGHQVEDIKPPEIKRDDAKYADIEPSNLREADNFKDTGIKPKILSISSNEENTSLFEKDIVSTEFSEDMPGAVSVLSIPEPLEAVQEDVYLESSVEEEPIYGKTDAPTLPEYVTVTPDSSPEGHKSPSQKDESRKSSIIKVESRKASVDKLDSRKSSVAENNTQEPIGSEEGRDSELTLSTNTYDEKNVSSKTAEEIVQTVKKAENVSNVNSGNEIKESKNKEVENKDSYASVDTATDPKIVEENLSHKDAKDKTDSIESEKENKMTESTPVLESKNETDELEVKITNQTSSSVETLHFSSTEKVSGQETSADVTTSELNKYEPLDKLVTASHVTQSSSVNIEATTEAVGASTDTVNDRPESSEEQVPKSQQLETTETKSLSDETENSGIKLPHPFEAVGEDTINFDGTTEKSPEPSLVTEELTDNKKRSSIQKDESDLKPTEKLVPAGYDAEETPIHVDMTETDSKEETPKKDVNSEKRPSLKPEESSFLSQKGDVVSQASATKCTEANEKRPSSQTEGELASGENTSLGLDRQSVEQPDLHFTKLSDVEQNNATSSEIKETKEMPSSPKSSQLSPSKSEIEVRPEKEIKPPPQESDLKLSACLLEESPKKENVTDAPKPLSSDHGEVLNTTNALDIQKGPKDLLEHFSSTPQSSFVAEKAPDASPSKITQQETVECVQSISQQYDRIEKMNQDLLPHKEQDIEYEKMEFSSEVARRDSKHADLGELPSSEIILQQIKKADVMSETATSVSDNLNSHQTIDERTTDPQKKISEITFLSGGEDIATQSYGKIQEYEETVIIHEKTASPSPTLTKSPVSISPVITPKYTPPESPDRMHHVSSATNNAPEINVQSSPLPSPVQVEAPSKDIANKAADETKECSTKSAMPTASSVSESLTSSPTHTTAQTISPVSVSPEHTQNKRLSIEAEALCLEEISKTNLAEVTEQNEHDPIPVQQSNTIKSVVTEEFSTSSSGQQSMDLSGQSTETYSSCTKISHESFDDKEPSESRKLKKEAEDSEKTLVQTDIVDIIPVKEPDDFSISESIKSKSDETEMLQMQASDSNTVIDSTLLEEERRSGATTPTILVTGCKTLARQSQPSESDSEFPEDDFQKRQDDVFDEPPKLDVVHLKSSTSSENKELNTDLEKVAESESGMDKSVLTASELEESKLSHEESLAMKKVSLDLTREFLEAETKCHTDLTSTGLRVENESVVNPSESSAGSNDGKTDAVNTATIISTVFVGVEKAEAATSPMTPQEPTGKSEIRTQENGSETQESSFSVQTKACESCSGNADEAKTMLTIDSEKTEESVPDEPEFTLVSKSVHEEYVNVPVNEDGECKKLAATTTVSTFTAKDVGDSPKHGDITKTVTTVTKMTTDEDGSDAMETTTTEEVQSEGKITSVSTKTEMSPLHKRSSPDLKEEPVEMSKHTDCVIAPEDTGSETVVDPVRILLESAVVSVVGGVASVSKNVTTGFDDAMSAGLSVLSSVVGVRKDSLEATRSCTPASDVDIEPSTPHSDISSGQVSRAPTNVSESDFHQDSDDDLPGSPRSLTSQVTHSPPHFDFDISGSHRSVASVSQDDQCVVDSKMANQVRRQTIAAPMNTSLYGAMKDDAFEETVDNKNVIDKNLLISSIYIPSQDSVSSLTASGDIMTTSMIGELSSANVLEFDQAVEEHRATRGSDLTKSIENVLSVVDSGFSDPPSLMSKPGGTEEMPQSSNASVKETTAVVSTSVTKETHKLTENLTDPEKTKDPIAGWGEPLGLPSPVPPPTNSTEESVPSPKGTPQKDRLGNRKPVVDNKKRPESPRRSQKPQKTNVIYIDLTYVPHHGNSYYTSLEFFKRVRARYYVFSGIEPSRDVYNALLEAKQTWEDKDLEVTIIPTYDTDTLGYWVAENEDALAKYKIDLSPSASRCTINLQDHETSCSAYRLEF